MEIIFISNNKNRPAVLCNGYRYNWVKDNVSKTSFWRCANRQECSASITINDNKTKIIRESIHSCVSNPGKQKRDIVVNAAKNKVCQSMASVKKLYEKTVLKYVKEEDNEKMSAFESVRDTLHRTRKRFLEVNTTEVSKSTDVEIPNIIKHNFLVSEYELDSHNKIFLFASKICKNYAQIQSSLNKTFFGDGTFKPVPIQFYQLFSIHVDGASDEQTTNVLPMLYALLPNKTQATYCALFTLIRDVLGIKINKYKCDFELAQINAFKEVFPHGKITGCYFHFSKAIWKKSDELQLTTTDKGKEIAGLVCILPLLPSSFINIGWNSIVNYAANCEGMSAFITYFEKQWLIKKSLISCCYERHRTNNAMEAWHRRLGVRIKKTTLIHFLYKLKKESRYQDMVVRGIFFKTENRKKKAILFDRNYRRELAKLRREDITPLNFLLNIYHLKYKLNYK